MKRYKKEQDGILEVGQVLYTKRFVLTLDRSLCKGCELCKLVCPRYAIELEAPEDDGAAVVDIDENKCDFHGICAVVCPFSAIKITVNGQDDLPAVTGDAFPKLARDIEVNSGRCGLGCDKCEEACPLGIVKVSQGIVDIQKELCAGCRICWSACPAGAIEVTKFIEGTISIESKACPDGCRRCLDVCPVDALELDERGKVAVRDMYCIYCGACLPVCPSEGTLTVERTAIRHTPVKSGAWNKGLERLTSTEGLISELTAERVDKTRAAIKNLMSGETQYE